MKKISATVICFLFFVIAATSQITKGIWIVGGEANFSYVSNSYKSSSNKQFSIDASPVAGYFLVDKFAMGLKPTISYTDPIPGNFVTTFDIGPFARYYFLNTENVINLFAEGSYAYGEMAGNAQTGGNRTTNTFSLSGGSVWFLNTSVGLEFAISYSASKIVDFSGYNKEIQFGVGLKYHLEKK